MNDSSTRYIKFSKNRLTYLQPIANFNDKDIDKVDIDQIIIEASMVYSSLERLEGIYKKLSRCTV